MKVYEYTFDLGKWGVGQGFVVARNEDHAREIVAEGDMMYGCKDKLPAIKLKVINTKVPSLTSMSWEE